MSLKQHNDIVEKLLKQIDTKDSQIESLKKQLQKAGGTQVMTTKNVDAQKEINKKITQIHKQYKEKINSLQQQIRNRSTQNKDLKQRLNTLKNLQAKQKQQASQILKKTANMASYDPKFAAVVSHYETQIQRKDKHIQNLQKQIKQNFYKLKSNGKQLKQQCEQNEQENEIPAQNIVQINKMPEALNDSHYHTRYQQEINNLKSENNKLNRIVQEKSKQFKDLAKRYSDLTKEYYKVLNQYGQIDNKSANQLKVNKKSAHQLPKNMMIKKSETGIGKILSQMLQDSKDETSSINSEQSLSFSFQSNYAKKQNGLKFQNKINEQQSEFQSLKNIVQNIQQMFHLSNHIEIIPSMAKMKSKLQQSNVYQNISKTIHSMLYRLGMGKIPMSLICEELEKLEVRICKLMESSDLLDEICIQAGAKKDKLLQKIKDFKATQEQLFTNMKDIDFMQKLSKANKIIQFINYFQLDKEQCQIPEQLRKMYEQLKYVDRFLKQAALILNKEPQGLQRSFESILRYLQLKEAEQGLIKDDKQTKGMKAKRK